MTPHHLQPVACGDGAWPFSLPGEGEAARWLVSLGLRSGDRVALAGLNLPATAQVVLAGLRMGLTLVPLNRRLAAAELRAQLAQAACRHVLAHPGHPLAGLAAHAALPESFPGSCATGGPPAGALVLFTSGSSGAPRPARLPATAIAAAVAAHVAALGLGVADRWVCPLPLDHVGGVMCVLRAAAAGCTVALHASADADALAADLDAGATGISVVPTVLRRLVAARNSRRWPAGLRHLLTGGGPLAPELAADCAALGLAPSQTYGLTEMASMATVLRPDDWAGHPASAGRCVPGARVRVVDGRIEVDGPMRFAGYEADGRLLPAPAGWHPTGDLGALAGDGFLTVHGRVSELIVSGGENVAASEVEAAIESHPAVAEAAVCGLPDPEWGEVVAAAVVLRGGGDPDELDAHLASRLAGFKRPRRWLFVDALPRTASGKLRRGDLRALFA